jgi:ubiquinone/menaquinone biosynthesis C-methylase UbiE
MNIEDVLSYLACPDDGESLILDKSKLICCKCSRDFQIEKNILNLTPKSRFTLPQNQNKNYEKYYENLRTSKSVNSGWGTIVNAVSIGFVKETLEKIKKFVNSDSIVCDIGAGSGDYSTSIALKAKIIFHCDLDEGGIQSAQKKSLELDLKNIFFIKCDYFKLPFKNNKIDLIFGIDVIERGMEYDQALIKEFYRINSKNGKILFDCHANERLKLTHRKSTLKLYFKEEILNFLNNNSFSMTEISGTGYIPQIKKWNSSEYYIFNHIAKILRFPPARWFIVCKKQIEK